MRYSPPLAVVGAILVSAMPAAAADRDGDGLGNRFERLRLHTNPRKADTDRDRLRDGFEYRRSKTSPVKSDTDGDGLSDWYERRVSLTNPRRTDTDRDGLSDGEEVLLGFDPLDPSSPPPPPEPGPDPAPEPAPDPTPDPTPQPDPTPEPDPDPTPPPPDPPVAAFDHSPLSPAVGVPVLFDGSGSSCPAAPCSYSWVDVGPDGPGGADWPLGAGQTLSFTFQGSGDKFVSLRVTDSLGRSDSEQKTVRVASAPDTSPPDTTITAGPSGSVESTSASFSFSSTEAGSSFQCRLNGGSFGACSSPKAYSGLTAGSHTFEVRATDAAGNQDQSPATRTWTVSDPPPPPPPGSCSQTLSPGANVAATVSGAAAGAVICLNAGSYGTVDLANFTKTSDVTVRSASGRTASLYLKLNNVRHVRFESLTLTGMYLIDARDASIVGNTFTGMSRVDTTTSTPNANIRIDSNTFDDITACGQCYEGRLTVRGYNNTQPVGVKITNNHFGNAGGSDGVQILGNAYGVEIGPGNEFSGFRQSGYSAHVDPIQLYGSSHTVISRNYFHDNNDASAIMAPDGGNAEQIIGNVFVGGSYYDAIQLGSHTGDTIAHNTIVGIRVSVDAKTGYPPSSGNVLRDNVITGALKTVSGAIAVEDYNLFPAGTGSGAHDLHGSPVFVGGATPSTMAGFQLAPGSLGTGAASDGTDIGAPLP